MLSFDFELLFTGLCLFTFEGDPQEPDEVNVLLLDTRNHNHSGGAHDGNGHDHVTNGKGGAHVPHEARLTYTLPNLTARSQKKHTIFPGPDGVPIARRALENELKLEVVPPARPAQKLATIWRPESAAGVQVPRTPEDERWLDWALRVQQIVPSFQLQKLATGGVTTRIRLTRGTLQAANVARGLNGGYLLWHFVDPNSGAFDRQQSQALAGSILLRLEGLTEPVLIDGFGAPVEFAPPAGASGGVVRVSVTNFPPEEPQDEDGLEHVTTSFALLAPLTSAGDTNPNRIARNADQLDTPGSTLCPPTRP